MRFLQFGFTVRRHQPLGHSSIICYISTHYQSPGFEPVSLVVYLDVCSRASNALKYNFFVILKHTNDMGNWISLSNRTNFGNELQYNFSLRFLSQDCGLLSPCNNIVLGVVLARNYIIKFLMNFLQLTLSFVAMCLL